MDVKAMEAWLKELRSRQIDMEIYVRGPYATAEYIRETWRLMAEILNHVAALEAAQADRTGD